MRGSAIARGLNRLADCVYKKGQSGAIGGALTAYDAENGKLHSGLFSAVAEKLSFSKKLKHTLARKTEQSMLVYAGESFFRRLAGLSMRFYGVLFACFGFAGAAMAIFKASLEDVFVLPSIPIFCCALIFACGLCALASGGVMAEELLENRLMSFIIFGIIGARRSAFEEVDRVKGSKLLAAVIGLVLGLATYVVPSYFLIGAFIGIIILYAILIIPEFGVVSTIFALSFFPTMVLVAMVSYTFLCYVLKFSRGKRTFRFSLIDGAVLVFMVFMALGGIVSVGGTESLKPALVYCCFMMGYFLVANLIRSEMWMKRSLYALLSSAAIVALYGIFENFFGTAITIWQDEDMFGDIAGRVISTFGNPNVLGEYLLMVTPFALAMIIVSKKNTGRFAGLFVYAVCCLCLVYTWSRGAWLGFIFEMALFLLVSTSKSLVLAFLGIASVPFAPLVLPSNIINRITSIGNMGDSSTSYRVYIWNAAVRMAKNFGLSGIGVGSEAFSKVYIKYSLSGIEKAPHAHNLFLQTWIELGLPGLLVFLAVIVILIQCSFTFFKKSMDGKMKSGKYLSLAGFCGIMGVLLQGLTDYIWYNYRVYLMFWIVIGLTVAIQNFSCEDSRCELETEI